MYAARPTTWLRTCSLCLVSHSVNTVRMCSTHCEATHTVWTQCGKPSRTVDDPHSGNTVRLDQPHCTATKHSPRMAEYGNRGSVELELRDCAKRWNIRYPCGRPFGHVFWLKFNKLHLVSHNKMGFVTGLGPDYIIPGPLPELTSLALWFRQEPPFITVNSGVRPN